mmetsp:Transcript_7209/g.10276  ORF Transcript_7209/g.10276 Transcript_7209/m.10276 type:complete len:681 (-) Transcript_7209:103-2145(-)
MYSDLNGKPQPQAHHPHSHEVMEILPDGSTNAGRRNLKRFGVLGDEHNLEALQQQQHKTQRNQIQAHHQHQHQHESQHPQQEARLLTDPTLIGTGSVSSYYSGIRGPSSLRQQYLEGAGLGVPVGAAPVPGTVPLNNVAIIGARTMRRRADLREFPTNGSIRGAGSGTGSLHNTETNSFAAITALNQVHRPVESFVTTSSSTSSNNGATAFVALDADMNMNSSMYPQHNPPSIAPRIGTTANAAGAPQQLLVGADNNLMLASLGVGQNVFVLPANQHQSQQLVYVQDHPGPAPSVHASEHSQLMNLVVGPNGQQYVTNIETPSIYSADDQHMSMNSAVSAAAAAATHQAQAQAQAHNIISNQQLQQLSLQQQARTAAAVAIQNQHQRMQVTRLLLEERQRQTALYSSLQGAGSVLDCPYLPTSSAQELLHQARMQGERQARLHGDNLLFADARSISSGLSRLDLSGISITGRAELPSLSRSQVPVATSSQRSEDVHSNSTSNNFNSVKDDTRLSNADKPRRPLSAYNFFFSEERERILFELDKKTEIAKEKEKKNDAEDGKDKGSGKEKGRSREDMDKFLEGSPIELTKDERKKLEDRIRAKTEKTLSVNLECDRPKKAPHRKSHGLGLLPLSKAISARWRNLKGEKRSSYDRLAKQDLHRYKKSMKDCSLKLSSHYKKK